MNRRDWMKAGATGAAPLLAATAAMGQGPQAAAQGRKLPPLRITNVRAILTQPATSRLIVVKVETNEPGLYGLGCATFTQRARVVETAIEKYLRPFLIGKDPLHVEDVFQSCFVSSYWRNAASLNNAISGVDMALWDIVGKRAGLPVYQLLGGKVRNGVDTYVHTNGRNFEEVEKAARAAMERGFRHIRVQVAVPGLSTYGVGGAAQKPDLAIPINQRIEVWEPGPYVKMLPRLFEHLRKQLGDQVELLHDVHERVPPILAMQLARDLEPYRLFFLEDPFSPEDVGYFEHLRRLTTTPLAMGELFNNVNEYLPLISGRLIDFIRIHVSQIGGLTMARKVAALCEFFAVRTAWHGPGDVSPVGHAANIHLDLVTPNFGIQELREFSAAEREVFPGCPELRDGYLHVSDRPGFGVDLDEKAAAKYPISDDPPFDMRWGNTRRRDGTIVKP